MDKDIEQVKSSAGTIAAGHLNQYAEKVDKKDKVLATKIRKIITAAKEVKEHIEERSK